MSPVPEPQSESVFFRAEVTMLQVLFEFILEVVLAPVFGITGHYVLWALTLGRWKPFEQESDWVMFVGALSCLLVLVLAALPFVL